MKINKENVGFVFIIVILLTLLGLSIYLGLSGWYFVTENNYATDLMLGNNIQIDVKTNQANAFALNYEGSFLPNEVLPQIIAIKNDDAENDAYIRVKSFVLGGNGVYLPLVVEQTDNWTYNQEDGYYYYNEKVASSNKVVLCNSVKLPSNNIMSSAKKYIMTFIVESLDATKEIQELWK